MQIVSCPGSFKDVFMVHMLIFEFNAEKISDKLVYIFCYSLTAETLLITPSLSSFSLSSVYSFRDQSGVV